MAGNASSVRHYQEPGRITRRVMNPAIKALTMAGVSVWGSRVLEVWGRKSGQARRTPENLLAFDGQQYLVSPRGEGEWVRNVRAAKGSLDLLVGRRRQSYTASEIANEHKVEILRAYLRRWKAEVGIFFGGVGPDSSDEELAAIAHRHPVFRLEASSGGQEK
jgi:deazaflavin-dependent oxidoreductase (nitroreductase family)